MKQLNNYTNMLTENTKQHEIEQHKKDDKVLFGFWVYLMTDLLMFAVLFATYAALRFNTFGGPSERELFNLPFVLFETLLLLTSSFTSGLALLAAHQNKKNQVLGYLFITFILGVSFVTMELSEFSHLVKEGHSWQASASLSSFFALVGTHGLHISSGLLWLGILMIYLFKNGLTHSGVRKLTMFSLFWHFLDIVWIFIFTVVYLMGASM